MKFFIQEKVSTHNEDIRLKNIFDVLAWFLLLHKPYMKKEPCCATVT